MTRTATLPLAAAALAGCGQGADCALAEAERAPLRAQALEWLRAELAVWGRRFWDDVRAALAASRSP
jgi:hypothetical protein